MMFDLQFLDHTAFDVAKHLLVESTKYSFNERYNLFFNDYSMTPLVIEVTIITLSHSQQNYLDSIKSKRYKEETTVEIMADAADSICDLENIQSLLMRDNVSIDDEVNHRIGNCYQLLLPWQFEQV